MKKLNKDNQGFTIIEVLIVLVIAAVIMLIVFLAVPALQRNSRNNGRRNDASRLGSAAVEYVTNHNGEMPQNANDVLSIAGDLSQYAPSAVSLGGPGAGSSDPDVIKVATDAECSTDGDTTSETRQIAIQFAVETAGSGDAVCIDA